MVRSLHSTLTFWTPISGTRIITREIETQVNYKDHYMRKLWSDIANRIEPPSAEPQVNVAIHSPKQASANSLFYHWTSKTGHKLRRHAAYNENAAACPRLTFINTASNSGEALLWEGQGSTSPVQHQRWDRRSPSPAEGSTDHPPRAQ